VRTCVLVVGRNRRSCEENDVWNHQTGIVGKIHEKGGRIYWVTLPLKGKKSGGHGFMSLRGKVGRNRNKKKTVF